MVEDDVEEDTAKLGLRGAPGVRASSSSSSASPDHDDLDADSFAIPTAARARGTPAPSLQALDDTTNDRTPIGAALLEENAPLDRDATERTLLVAVASGHEPSRFDYADWLEDRSEHARAGFLRLEQFVSKLTPTDPRFEPCTRQLRELVQHIGPDWRARVARPPIERCALSPGVLELRGVAARERCALSPGVLELRGVAARGRCALSPGVLELRGVAARERCGAGGGPSCPGRWDALERTEREEVRTCLTCACSVYYFESVDDARATARRGHPVAIDLASERWQDDLVDIGTRCPCCARRIVSRARFCPHCGQALSRRS